MSKAEEIRNRINKLQEELEREELKEGKVTPINKNADDENVIEGEVLKTEDVDANEDDENTDKVVTLVQIGYTSNGRPFFNVEGEVNLLVLEGLLNFAHRQVNKEWELREIAAERARREAEERAKQQAEKDKEDAIRRSSRNGGRI